VQPGKQRQPQRLDTARRLQRRRLVEANSNNLRFLEVLQLDVPEKVQRRHPRVAQQIDHRPGEMRQEQFPATPDDIGFISSVKFRLTSPWPSAFFSSALRNTNYSLLLI
jgi:hypothetical protein